MNHAAPQNINVSAGRCTRAAASDVKRSMVLAGVLLVTFFLASTARADEYLFGFVGSADTLPQGHSELYQYLTLRTGKSEGTYCAVDSFTEIEHAFTNRLEADLGIENNYLYSKDVNGSRDRVEDTNAYYFGGGVAAVKYCVLSPFMDPLGLSLRLEGGYLPHNGNGQPQHESYLAPELILQKDFLDDTLICDLNLGTEFGWNTKPPQPYDRELALTAAGGVSYRIAPDWFLGFETHMRADYPDFDVNNFEHFVVYAGPALHYASRDWWVTLTWNYQVYGEGAGEPSDGQTFAEQTRQLVRIIVGFNF